MSHHRDDGPPARIEKQTIAEALKEIEMCMMTTVAPDDHLHSRPMANNRQVEWNGDTWFFTYEDSSQAAEIMQNPKVNLAYSLREKVIFISVAGTAEIVRDAATKTELWQKELYEWFPEGPDDETVVLIRVSADHIHYWDKERRGSLQF